MATRDLVIRRRVVEGWEEAEIPEPCEIEALGPPIGEIAEAGAQSGQHPVLVEAAILRAELRPRDAIGEEPRDDAPPDEVDDTGRIVRVEREEPDHDGTDDADGDRRPSLGIDAPQRIDAHGLELGEDWAEALLELRLERRVTTFRKRRDEEPDHHPGGGAREEERDEKAAEETGEEARKIGRLPEAAEQDEEHEAERDGSNADEDVPAVESGDIGRNEPPQILVQWHRPRSR